MIGLYIYLIYRAKSAFPNFIWWTESIGGDFQLIKRESMHILKNLQTYN